MCVLLLSIRAASAAESGDVAVVIYNSRMAESRSVAEHYAAARQVPPDQVFGFDLPQTETMTRTEFHDRLELPLFHALEKNHLFVLQEDASGKEPYRRVVSSKIRYAVLCYGVPVRILRDPDLKEEGLDKLQPELRRNEAAVDSDLAMLPLLEKKIRLAGPLPNPLYGATNAAMLSPTNGLLLVARLDGPSAKIASALVDRAITAETDGLWGRAYFDCRGITSGEFKPGDDWLHNGATVCRRFGFETIVDDKPATFSADFPLSHVAFYAGWYDGAVSGPFTRPEVEFMPGAFAYHLHSFSAHEIRNAGAYWVGPLLAKGATMTMGSVDEPFLAGTPDIGVFLARLIGQGYSFGEAAYAGQSVISWQTTVIGDPLYRPFGKKPQLQHEELLRRGSKLIEWSHLRVVDINQALNESSTKLIDYIEKLPAAEKGAALWEKLGDLYIENGKLGDAIEGYTEALKRSTSPQQRKRLMLLLAGKQILYENYDKAQGLYEQFLKDYPEYADKLSVYQKLVKAAQELKKPEEAARYQKEVDRLTTK